MCGIGGILRFDGRPVETAPLQRMLESLACRGPDDRQILTDGPVGLVHARLAVIDPQHGRQPMRSGACTVVFNGEIYNHAELRGELTGLGHRFTTDHSDTEVLLHGYRQWVEDLPNHLRGMYALALWDGEELYLARDPVGKKPLYFWHDDQQFVFASTVAAVAAAVGPGLDIDPLALRLYLAFGYTCGPTLLRGITELPPRRWLRLSPRRSDHTPSDRPADLTAPRSLDDFEALLRDAVRCRLEADVPLGCFLSGGIDSSLVAAFAQQELAGRGLRLKTFCMAMPDPAYDEAPFARRVAQHLGTDHLQLTAQADVEADLRRLLRTMGQPLADSSLLPTYWLSKAARQHVTVALSGDGGDELFGGYDRYIAIRLLHRHAWWTRLLPAGLFAGEQKTPAARIRRFILAARRPTLAQRYFHLVRLFDDEQLLDLGLEPLGRSDDPLLADWPATADPADAARLWDYHHYLPGDLLHKVDRASMAVALEVRCPMLDRALVQAALNTPMRRLVPGRQPKALLRKLAGRYLPADIVNRPKAGFALPIGRWFGQSLKPLLHQALLDGPLENLGLRRNAIQRLIDQHLHNRPDHTHRLFALLALALWLDEQPTGRS